jgi:hypothetical protein
MATSGRKTMSSTPTPKLPYEPGCDLVAVVSLSDNFVGIGTSASLKVNSLNEFVKRFPTSRDQLAAYQIGCPAGNAQPGAIQGRGDIARSRG